MKHMMNTETISQTRTKIGETKMDDSVTVEQWLTTRKEAGLQIDAETAEVEWRYVYTLDPYGIDPDLPEECQMIGRAYFARSPGTDVWVCFCDLPEATVRVLWERLEHGEFDRGEELPWDD
jgi:hypothetical protein